MRRIFMPVNIAFFVLLTGLLFSAGAVARQREPKSLARDSKAALIVDGDGFPEERTIELIQVIPIRGNNPFDPMDPLGAGHQTVPGPADEILRCVPSVTAYEDALAQIVINPQTGGCRLEPFGMGEPNRAIVVEKSYGADDLRIVRVHVNTRDSWEAIPPVPSPFTVNIGSRVDLVIRQTAAGDQFRIVFVPEENRLRVLSLERLP